MENLKPVDTPIETGMEFRNKGQCAKVDPIYFKSFLCYLIATRSDILCGVGLVNRYMKSLTQIHFQNAKRILRSIKRTLDHGMFYMSSDDLSLVGYTDNMAR